MHQLGIEGMPRRTYHYVQSPEWGLLNLIATIGVYLIAVSILIFIFNFPRSIVIKGGKGRRRRSLEGDMSGRRARRRRPTTSRASRSCTAHAP